MINHSLHIKCSPLSSMVHFAFNCLLRLRLFTSSMAIKKTLASAMWPQDQAPPCLLACTIEYLDVAQRLAAPCYHTSVRTLSLSTKPLTGLITLPHSVIHHQFAHRLMFMFLNDKNNLKLIPRIEKFLLLKKFCSFPQLPKFNTQNLFYDELNTLKIFRDDPDHENLTPRNTKYY